MTKTGLAALMLAAAACTQAGFINPATGNYYELVGGDGSWASAQAEATALGGNLVTINSAAEEDWLRSVFGTDSRFWIGFTDASVEGVWEWVSGEAVTYLNWDMHEPNDAASGGVNLGEDFAVLNWNGATGAWNDWDVDRPDYSFVMGIAEIEVPAPGIVILMGLGLVGIALARRRIRA